MKFLKSDCDVTSGASGTLQYRLMCNEQYHLQIFKLRSWWNQRLQIESSRSAHVVSTFFILERRGGLSSRHEVPIVLFSYIINKCAPRAIFQDGNGGCLFLILVTRLQKVNSTKFEATSALHSVIFITWINLIFTT